MMNNWHLVNLAEVAITKKGKKPRDLGDFSDNRTIPYIDIQAFELGNIRQFCSEDGAALCQEDDVLIVWDGARSGLVGIGVRGAVGSTLSVVKIPLIRPKFLYYFLQSKFAFLNTNTRGVGIPHIDPNHFGNLLFPLTSDANQIAIISKIEELFSHIDAGVEGLKQTKAKLQQYRQSVLKDAVTGKLTEKWREQNADKLEPADKLLERILTERRENWEQEQLKAFTLAGRELKGEIWKSKYKQPLSSAIQASSDFPNSWEVVSPDMIFISVTDGDHQAPPRAEQGIPFLVIGDVKSGNIVISDKRFVPQSYYDEIRFERKPLKGDLLYTVVGSYGIPVRVDTDSEFCVQRHIAILKPTSEIITDFYFHVFNSGFVRKQADSVATGTAQKTVPLGGLRRFQIPLPPLLEQEEIVRLVNEKLETTNRVFDAVEAKIKYSSALKASLLKKAFAGELVSNESEQTALELLEKIKEEKQHLVKGSKGKTKKERKVTTGRKSLVSVLKTIVEPVSPEELMQLAGFMHEEVEEFYIELAAFSDQLEKVSPTKEQLKNWPYEKDASLKLKLKD